MLTNGPKQILSGSPDKLKGKPELGLLARRGEGQLAQAVVDAQVDLRAPGLTIVVTITLPLTSVKLGWPLVSNGGRFVSRNFTVVTECPFFSSSAVTDWKRKVGTTCHFLVTIIYFALPGV